MQKGDMPTWQSESRVIFKVVLSTMLTLANPFKILRPSQNMSLLWHCVQWIENKKEQISNVTITKKRSIGSLSGDKIANILLLGSLRFESSEDNICLREDRLGRVHGSAVRNWKRLKRKRAEKLTTRKPRIRLRRMLFDYQKNWLLCGYHHGVYFPLSSSSGAHARKSELCHSRWLLK